MEKPREWWIDPAPCDEEMPNTFDCFSFEPDQGPLNWRASLIRVVPARAYEAERTAHAETKARLEEELAEQYAAGVSAGAHAERKRADELAIKLHESNMNSRTPMTNTGWPYEKKLHEQLAELRAQAELLAQALEKIHDMNFTQEVADAAMIAEEALEQYRNGTRAGAKTPSETDIDPERDERFGGR